MADLGTLFVAIDATTKDFDKKINQSEKKTIAFGDSLTSLSKTASVAIAGIAVASTKLASDLNESINATNVVFGESADIILDWGETASTQAGLSQTAFNESSAIIGTLLKKTGDDLTTNATSMIMSSCPPPTWRRPSSIRISACGTS